MNEPHAIKLKKLFVKTSGDFLMKRQTIAGRYAPRDCHNAGSQDRRFLPAKISIVTGSNDNAHIAAVWSMVWRIPSVHSGAEGGISNHHSITGGILSNDTSRIKCTRKSQAAISRKLLTASLAGLWFGAWKMGRVRAGWHFCQQQAGCRYLVKQICVFRRVNHINAASHNANGAGR